MISEFPIWSGDVLQRGPSWLGKPLSENSNGEKRRTLGAHNHVIDVNRQQSSRFVRTPEGAPGGEGFDRALRRSHHHERWAE